MKSYSRSGLSFQYPGNWTLEEQLVKDSWSATVQSPSTAFMLIQHDAGMPALEKMAEAVLEVLREEYPELEADERIDTLAGQPAFGHDACFFSLDLTSTCWTRCFYAPEGTVQVMCQVTDHELDTYGPVLRAMCASMKLDDGG